MIKKVTKYSQPVYCSTIYFDAASENVSIPGCLKKIFKNKLYRYLQKVEEFNSILNIENLAWEIQQLRNKTEKMMDLTTKRANDNRRISPAELYETPKCEIVINNDRENVLEEEKVKVHFGNADYFQEMPAMKIKEDDKLI